MGEEVTNPFSELATAATAMHEMFLSYVAAGFTEAQALWLVVCIAVGGPREPK